MAPTKVGFYTRLAPELRAAMRAYKEQVGVPEAVQVDRALREWLAERITIATPTPTRNRAARRSKREKGESR